MRQNCFYIILLLLIPLFLVSCADKQASNDKDYFQDKLFISRNIDWISEDNIMVFFSRSHLIAGENAVGSIVKYSLKNKTQELIYENEKFICNHDANIIFVPKKEIIVQDSNSFLVFDKDTLRLKHEGPVRSLLNVSPNGEQIAYCVTTENNIVEDSINIASLNNIEKPIVAVPAEKKYINGKAELVASPTKPVWSPDGKSLAFLYRFEIPEQKQQIGILDRLSNKTTFLSIGESVSNIAWNDEDTIIGIHEKIFDTDNPGITILDTKTGKYNKIPLKYDIRFQDTFENWVLLLGIRFEGNRIEQLMLLDINTGNIKNLSSNLNKEVIDGAKFSPSGKKVAYILRDQDLNSKIVIVELWKNEKC